MALSSKVKNKLVDAINVAFTSIGHAAGMQMPRCTGNQAPAAWELWVSQHVLSLATKRKERAEQEAIKAGVIFDKEKEPREGGTRETVFNGECVSVMLEVRGASKRVSADKMADYLVSKGVKQALIDEARIAATSTSRAAHVFTTTLITDNGSVD
jgi:hypothetical protein